MNQSEFLAMSCNLLKARQKLRVLGANCFGFGSHWLKNWRETFKPSPSLAIAIKQLIDSHLKITLLMNLIVNYC